MAPRLNPQARERRMRAMAVGELDLRIHVVLGATGDEVAVIAARPDQTVRTLKKRIEDLEGTAPRQQRLLFGSNLLSNSHILADLGIREGSMVQLVRLLEEPISRVGTVVGGGITMASRDEDVFFEPTDDDVDEYAVWLGIDPEAEGDLLWIAWEGLKTPVRDPWRVGASGDHLFYFNVETKESRWEHPIDEVQRSKYQRLKDCKTRPQPPSNPGVHMPAHRTWYAQCLEDRLAQQGDQIKSSADTRSVVPYGDMACPPAQPLVARAAEGSRRSDSMFDVSAMRR